MRFCDTLRYLRNKDNMTQQELAEKIGISLSAISMYERGQREPNFETLEAIADYFNVDMNQLMGRDDNVSRSTNNDTTKQKGSIATPKLPTTEEQQLLRAYNAAPLRDKNIVRVTLNLPLLSDDGSIVKKEA